MDGVDLADWAASHRDQVDAWFDTHGAILFRGFGLSGVEDFERVAGAIAGELFAEYGDLPPESASQKVYGSTPYPADKMILFHNESSHLPTWPLRQFFFCVIPSADRWHDAAARLASCLQRARSGDSRAVRDEGA